MKDIIKIEITPTKNGWIMQAHGDDGKGKVLSDTYACESGASLMRRLPVLLKKMRCGGSDDQEK